MTPQNTPFKLKINILDKLLYSETENSNKIDQRENNRQLKLKISAEIDKKRKEIFSERLITNEKMHDGPQSKNTNNSHFKKFHNIIKNNLTLLQSSSNI